MASCAEEREPLLPREGAEEPGTSTTCWGRVRRLLCAVTVEPACFLYAVTFGMTMALLPNLWVDKICLVQLDYGEETCASLQQGKDPAKQDAVQRVSAKMSLYFQVLLFVPAVFANLLLGAWADARGRRFPVLAPVVGSLLMALVIMANCYWWSLSPALLLLAALPAGCTGSMMAVFSGSYAYVGAVASRRARRRGGHDGVQPRRQGGGAPRLRQVRLRGHPRLPSGNVRRQHRVHSAEAEEVALRGVRAGGAGGQERLQRLVALESQENAEDGLQEEGGRRPLGRPGPHRRHLPLHLHSG